MKFMKMDPQNRLYSRDVVKTATLVIFFTFSEKFQLFYKKVDFPQKSFCGNRKNQKIMQKYTFATPGSARRGAISQFPSNYCEIHQIPQIIGELLLISRF